MNVVLKKDVLSLLRLKRVVAIQLAFVAMLAGLVLATWPTSGVIAGSVSVQRQDRLPRGRAHQEPAAQSDAMLLGLMLGQLVLAALFVPGIACVSLVGEKEQNTLEMLYASRLRPGEIVLGKVGGALVLPAVLLVSGLPLAALLHFRGQVAMGQLAWSYAVVAAGAGMIAMLSLAISAVARTSAGALVAAYVSVLVICGGVLVPAAIMLEGQAGGAAAGLHYARAVSPVAALLAILSPQMGNGDFAGSAHGLMSSWVVFLPLAAAVSGASFAVVAAKLRRPGGGEELGRSAAQEEQSVLRRMLVLIDPNKKRRPIGWRNPVIVKESRTNNLRSGRWLIRVFYTTLLLSLLLAVMSLYGGTSQPNLLAYVAKVLVCLQVAVCVLVTPSLTSPVVSGEIETGTFELLRLAPLSAGRIFWGKFLPAIGPAILPMLGLLPAYAAVWYVDPGYLARFARLVPVLLMAVGLCATVGMAASCFAGNSARATVAGYLIVTAIVVGPALVWMLGGARLETRAAAMAATPSSLAMAMALMPGGDPAVEARYSAHLWTIAAVCVVMVVAARLKLARLVRKG